ncbi:MAG: hypothetical protein FJW40_11220, partial [Acidobacteria bacterium]|nr:hypothetical protein [Acidobacteriota bacterium]
MKELVEHVRTIHFALAILAVSLFLLIQRPQHAGFRKAVEDAEAIHELAENLRHEAAVGDVLRLVRGQPELLRLRRSGREEWAELPRSRYEGAGGREPVLFNITLLSEFIQLWGAIDLLALLVGAALGRGEATAGGAAADADPGLASGQRATERG